MTTDESQLMSAEEVADLLHVKVSTVNTWAKKDKLRGVKFNNGRWRFWREDVMKALGNGPAS